MVTVSIDDKGLNGHILLKPNLSLSWKQNARLFVVVLMILSVISGYFVSLGGWLVLPFSGLEIILIGVSLYLFFQHYNCQEVIHFNDDRLVIERGKDKPEKTWVYQRHWSKFHIHEHSLYDIPKVCLVSHGKELELGAFLGYDEKMLFIKKLEQITLNYQRQF